MCARTKKRRLCSVVVIPTAFYRRHARRESPQPSKMPLPGDCVPPMYTELSKVASVHLGQPIEGESAAEVHPQRRAADDVQNDVPQVA